MNNDEEIDPMGWRLNRSVVRGIIDARVRDRVTGKIWLIDRQFPIDLKLKGSPLKDLAGCLLMFENPSPANEDNEGLCPVQMGRTGDITASRKIRMFDLSFQQVTELRQRGEPVDFRVGNALLIEWFSNANGRVIIESTDFKVQISDYTWRMTSAEEKEQARKNQESFDRWSEIVDYETNEDDEDDDLYNWTMDEFDWEKQLQESDAMTDRYMELIETYLDHPEREQLIAHEMGWDGLEDVFEDMDEDDDADGAFAFAGGLSDDDDDDEPFLPLEPIAKTEGRDWILAADGKVKHPLSDRAATLAMNIWRCYKAQGLTDEGMRDPDAQSLLFNAQTLSAKLAGALDSLAYDDDPDGGFIVACLKRSLKQFGQTIHCASIVSQKNILPAATLQGFRDEFFAIRQEILNLMQFYRQLN
ncbi:MAG TPA: hypothetical protein DCS43_08150 [Verrucomicrobia bacterium]|nr:hypothetical protein [Verrucomicrobiota bacterium]